MKKNLTSFVLRIGGKKTGKKKKRRVKEENEQEASYRRGAQRRVVSELERDEEMRARSIRELPAENGVCRCCARSHLNRASPLFSFFFFFIPQAKPTRRPSCPLQIHSVSAVNNWSVDGRTQTGTGGEKKISFRFVCTTPRRRKRDPDDLISFPPAPTSPSSRAKQQQPATDPRSTSGLISPAVR